MLISTIPSSVSLLILAVEELELVPCTDEGGGRGGVVLSDR